MEYKDYVNRADELIIEGLAEIPLGQKNSNREIVALSLIMLDFLEKLENKQSSSKVSQKETSNTDLEEEVDEKNTKKGTGGKNATGKK